MKTKNIHRLIYHLFSNLSNRLHTERKPSEARKIWNVTQHWHLVVTFWTTITIHLQSTDEQYLFPDGYLNEFVMTYWTHFVSTAYVKHAHRLWEPCKKFKVTYPTSSMIQPDQRSSHLHSPKAKRIYWHIAFFTWWEYFLNTFVLWKYKRNPFNFN